MTSAPLIAAATLALLLAACTAVTPRPSGISPGTYVVRLNQSAGGPSGLTVVEVVEDSRCPSGVQCIHAGTVRIRVTQPGQSGDFLLKLGEPRGITAGWATLLSVCPSRAAGRPILREDYRFTISLGAARPASPLPGPGPCPPS